MLRSRYVKVQGTKYVKVQDILRYKVHRSLSEKPPEKYNKMMTLYRSMGPQAINLNLGDVLQKCCRRVVD